MASNISAFLLILCTFWGTYSCSQVKSFGDFLEYNHLKHGIIIMCKNVSLPMKELKEITRKPIWLSFYQVDKISDKNNVRFEDLFYYGAPKVGISFDIECQSTEVSILDLASTNSFFNSSQAWFILSKSLEVGLKALENLVINIDADITLGIKTQKNDILDLYDVFKVCHKCGTSLQSLKKGKWSVSGGMQMLPYFLKSSVQRRMNFTDITLRGGLVLTTIPKGIPIIPYIESYSHKHLDLMQRKGYHIQNIMKEIYNFRLKTVLYNEWGVLKEGNWTGEIKDLAEGKLDLTLSPLRFTPERIYVVRYLHRVHVETLGFLFRHPRRSPIRNKFLEPFTQTVWFTILATAIVAIAVMAITMRFECKSFENGININTGAENKLDFFTLVILETIFLQGPSQLFQLVSSRTLILTICILAVMLNQFYSAFIVGSLLADVPRTIVDMPSLFNSSLDVGFESIAYSYEMFTNTSNQMAKDIYVHRILRNPDKNILSLQKGLDRIAKGGYAFHVALVRAYRLLKVQLAESEFCDLQEVAMEPPFPTFGGVAHGSPFKDHFGSGILKLRETGITSYHDKLWSIDKPQCSKEMMDTDTTVDMEHFIPALGLLTLATLTSLIILGVELLVHYFHVQK